MSKFHPMDLDAMDTIDAMVFSGDALQNKKNADTFQEMLDRWAKGLKEAREIAEEKDK